MKTRQALKELSISFATDDLDCILAQLENMLQQKFPEEFKVSIPLADITKT